MQSQSSMEGGRASVLTEEMLGLFTYLFQEGERGVSSEQRAVGQMASACEERTACESVVDGMFYRSCDTYANVLLP